MKTLVTYFSAESGRTAGVAKELADAIGAGAKELKAWVEESVLSR